MKETGLGTTAHARTSLKVRYLHIMMDGCRTRIVAPPRRGICRGDIFYGKIVFSFRVQRKNMFSLLIKNFKNFSKQNFGHKMNNSSYLLDWIKTSYIRKT